MAQNTQEENKAIYLDPFRYNQFEGFNSHNHVVVTEVGEGTSVVEVEMTQDGMNPLNMAHGGLIFTLCDVATGVAVRTGAVFTSCARPRIRQSSWRMAVSSRKAARLVLPWRRCSMPMACCWPPRM